MDSTRSLFARIGAMPIDRETANWGSDLGLEDVGLLAIGGALDPSNVLAAYRLGVFPWPLLGEDGPVFWCSPDPRFVLSPGDLHVSRSLEKTLRRGTYSVRFDHDFEAVIRTCAELERPRHEGTWITESMIDAYVSLHNQGHAHSVESYQGDELVGGLYGIASGGVFFGESMFSKATDASKVAFTTLVRRLGEAGYQLIDCQQPTGHLARFGAKELDRRKFLDRLGDALLVGVQDGCFDDVPTSSEGWVSI